MNKINILFQISKDDEPYLNLLKGIFANLNCSIKLNSATPATITEVFLRAKEKSCTHVLVSEVKLLQLLVEDSRTKIDDYQGSIIEWKGMEFLILPPIKHIVIVPYGRFLYQRFLSKFLAPEKWLQLPAFAWELFREDKTDEVIDIFGAAHLIAIDIETGDMNDRVITCVGFTAVTFLPTLQAYTVVVPFTSEYNLAVIRVLCQLSPMKVFQNGKYDNAYFLRFGISTYNWAGDTLNLFHSWLSELPKDLGFISAFTLRKWQYWKDSAHTSDLKQYYEYNARDSFATAFSFIAMMLEVPTYAWNNYYQEFPQVYPCLLAEMTGLRQDLEALGAEREKFTASLEIQLASLQKMVAPKYNPSSPKQTLELFAILGSGDITSSDEKNRDKVMDRHPLNRRVLKAIDKYREDRKMVGTYLQDKTWNGRFLYSISPSGTDTGRLSSGPSAFWSGQNMQNWPRDRVDINVRNTIISDDGFYFGECDYAQNEARGTAYISGDTALIAAVDDTTRDFHGINASRFFGVPYEKIVQSIEVACVWEHKTLDKALRNDIGKRINHGANYNMGPGVMLDTMGIANVRRAQLLLQLPTTWSLLRVCAHLLQLFDDAYPVVRGAAYDKHINDILGTGCLVGPTGWTRRCFGNPKTNKHWLNAYVAHPPQSLGAIQLNIAYLNVFKNIAITESKDFKLGPQIHDSILFQYREGRIDLVWKVADAMKVSIPVKDTFGKVRVLEVPVDTKGEATKWSEVQVLRRPALLATTVQEQEAVA